mmetsp:Transcript_21978/g.65706  ORF Transcript_21978/g.65706 Transcript_21978/m.65706 type:complete len:231 (-) Transcript_21978:1531-2223(-)
MAPLVLAPRQLPVHQTCPKVAHRLQMWQIFSIWVETALPMLPPCMVECTCPSIPRPPQLVWWLTRTRKWERAGKALPQTSAARLLLVCLSHAFQLCALCLCRQWDSGCMEMVSAQQHHPTPTHRHPKATSHYVANAAAARLRLGTAANVASRLTHSAYSSRHPQVCAHQCLRALFSSHPVVNMPTCCCNCSFRNSSSSYCFNTNITGCCWSRYSCRCRCSSSRKVLVEQL